MKNKYKIITFIVSAIICLIVIYLHLLSHKKTQKIYLQQTEKIIMDLKKDFLKNTVDNIFLEIDSLRETEYRNCKKNVNTRLRRFHDELNLTDEEFIKFFMGKFSDDLEPEMWTALLWNNKTGKILYGTANLNIKSTKDNVKDLKSLLSFHAVIEKGDIEGVFGVSKFYINELVKNEIGNVIRNREFSNDSYLWVNQVINYEGGKDYAIRKKSLINFNELFRKRNKLRYINQSC